MMHRDSTGVVQRIEPGAINWMIAGRGIVHSERTPDDLRGATRAHARPAAVGGAARGPRGGRADRSSTRRRDTIPQVQVGGAQVRVLIGEAFGVVSPVTHAVADALSRPAAAPRRSMVLTAQAPERALYGVDHGFIGRRRRDRSRTRWSCWSPAAAPACAARSGSRLVLIGGAPLGHRVTSGGISSAAATTRIQRAQDDWAAQRFGQVPGESEFIPLPEPRR